MTDKHDADLQRVGDQNKATDWVRGYESSPHSGMLFGWVDTAIRATPVGAGVAARTDFGHLDLPLNKMIDLVEQTDPEDLESSGKALWDARDAIKAAADELDGHIQKVHWVGKSGDSFREWGGKLVTHTHYLSEFAGAAGDQITAAAVGLAAVRGAMPPRDTEANRTRPDKFTAAEKAADKEGYATAVKVEKDRQEAINQMNRLASYYAVSEEVLSLLPEKDKTPAFTSMPDVGVPQPSKRYGVDQPVSAVGSGAHGGTGPVSGGGHHATAMVPNSDAPRHVTSDGPTPAQHITDRIPSHPDQPVGTHIDHTGTLPPPTTSTPGPSHTPPVTSTPPTTGGQPDVFGGGGYRLPMPNATSGRGLSGAGGFRTPPSAQGRTGTSRLTNPGSGRATARGPMDEMGRAASAGQSTAKGTASGARSSSPMGRGVTGGTPRPGGAEAARTSSGPATGAGRSNGVVGGRPSATNPTSKNGSRLPRGTVIGGEEEANSRSTTGRLGQRGVFGPPESTARPGARATGSRLGAGTSEPVTGSPTSRNSAAGAERNGMTRGGAGLTRGAGHNGKPGDARKTEGSPRPDYLVEDEETHLPDKPRRDVPPVVN
ncbi:hypothetical protein FB563_1065 [Streptomyces puniciscabiei]|uniref:PPE family protein n=1 Tax=Streptomyces puniciscabiei TaxID=164348 RepID=A0A542UAL9_9ACTN|nr:WXG100 family type VII secretion target [Streptomyces puniciscabiei]TQK96132.1 hypothetical protein FB563_1065 [Streptomyces puniciscabiei]